MIGKFLYVNPLKSEKYAENGGRGGIRTPGNASATAV